MGGVMSWPRWVYTPPEPVNIVTVADTECKTIDTFTYTTTYYPRYRVERWFTPGATYKVVRITWRNGDVLSCTDILCISRAFQQKRIYNLLCDRKKIAIGSILGWPIIPEIGYNSILESPLGPTAVACGVVFPICICAIGIFVCVQGMR
jgi:hypothetical protein